jgi:hypothetical protein
MVLTVSFVISLVTGLCCHHHQRIISADLTPASGRQDHTTSPSASRRFVCAPLTSTASRLTLVTIAKRPSGRQDGVNMNLIWVKRETENFCGGGWTGGDTSIA